MDAATAQLIGASVSAIANVAGNYVAASSSEKVQKLVNQHAWKMAQWQNQINRENWTMQNEYNSPTAQMQRLQEAGLNPNLVYGTGAVGNNANSVHAAPNVPVGGYMMPQNMMAGLGQLGEAFMNFVAMRKQEAEIGQIKETTNLTRLQGDLASLDILAKNFQNAKTAEEAKVWSKLLSARLDMMRASTNDVNSKVEYRRNVETPIGIKQLDVMDANIAASKASARNSDASTSNIYARMVLIPLEAQKIRAEIQGIFQNIHASQAQIQKIWSEIDNIDSRTSHQERENKIKDILLKNGINLNEGGISGLVGKFSYLTGGYLDNLFDIH